MRDNWKIWDGNKAYGKVFYERATGKLPEMESSKAVARHVAQLAKKNDLILDAGCGGGHYLVSLDRTLKIPFRYYGIDATANYIKLARTAFAKKINNNPLRMLYEFKVADIFDIDLADGFADIVMCNNVLLHLPSIEKPIKELWRVAKKYLVIRTLIGKVSFRIPPEKYTKDGEPCNFHYFNIYSQEYIQELVDKLPGVKSHRLFEDTDFNPSNIGASNYKNRKRPHNLTTIINGMQVNNYVILPMKFLIIEKGK